MALRLTLTTPADDLARRAAEMPSAPALFRDSRDGGDSRGGEPVQDNADSRGGEPVRNDGAVTYGELDRRATVLADRFRAWGAARGDTVTLCTTPGPDTVASLFGLWRAGCIAVPLHEGLTPSEVDYARRTVMPTLHIDNRTLHSCHAGRARLVGRARFVGRTPRRRSGGLSRGLPAAAPPDRYRYAGFPEVVAFILTSGSLGAPKAVGFTRAAFAASASAVARRLGLSADDRWGLCLSLGHIGGLSLVLRAVMTGASVRLWPAFDADTLAGTVLQGRVTHLAVVPVMLRRLLARLGGRRVPPALRCVLVGGAAASRALVQEAWAAGLPVAATWGMTETASQVATASPGLTRRRPGTVGRPLPSVEVRAVRRRARGTLEVRGPTLASVVVRGPGAHPEPIATDPDGWFSTRDLGRIDPDGLVWIEGRADAIIVSGGLNVSPAEVERVIEGLSGVREAVVFGLPDEEWGEVVAAVVEGDPASVTAEQVDRHCRARLARGRCPTRIAVVYELPRTQTGKVMRSRVRERFGARPEAVQDRADSGAPTSSPWTKSPRHSTGDASGPDRFARRCFSGE